MDTLNHSGPVGRRQAFGLYVVGIVLVAAAAAAAYRLLGERKARLLGEIQVRAQAAMSGPAIQVVIARRSSPERTITLLGEAHPDQTATLYAKVSGYLREVRVDKGDKVTANEVLAVIESPETDHQYQAAVADAQNKRLNAGRARKLVERQMISLQEADQAEADAQVAEANVAALATLKSYEVLRAPFDGTVTARFADPGALMQNAATSETSALPVVTVSEIGRLRVFVYPDQRDAAFIRVGTPAVVSMPERPEITVNAQVTRMSGELDAKTRTMLTEIDFENRRSLILPGSFVTVSLRVRTMSAGAIELPAEALVLRGDKPFVAVVTSDHRVTFRPVTIADDNGAAVRILSGVQPGERVAISLGDSVVEGDRVQPVERSP